MLPSLSKMGLIKLSVLTALSLLSLTVLGDDTDVVRAELSHLPPAFPPVETPKPRTGHHHHPHHHNNPPASPPAGPPVEAPKLHEGHHHHHHNHTPTPPPIKPPTHSPVKPPVAHPPVVAPVHPPAHPLPERKLVAVQGVVYCKSCKYAGIDTLLGATPLMGAVVRLQCNNTKYPLKWEAMSDKNGYFLIRAEKQLTTAGSHKCKVSLVSSTVASCNKPTDLHSGSKGAILMPNKPNPPVAVPPYLAKYQLFTVGPFAFEPSGKLPCPR